MSSHPKRKDILQDFSWHVKTAVAKSNALGGKEFEDDDASPFAIPPNSGALSMQGGWVRRCKDFEQAMYV